MPLLIGWTDQRETFYFQKPALSADMDAMAQNNHRMLIQAGLAFTFPLVNGFIQLDADAAPGPTTWLMQFAVPLFDDCPWNRIRFATYIDSFSGTFTASFSGAGVTSVNKTQADFTAGSWGTWAEADLAGVTPGPVIFSVTFTATGAATNTLRFGTSYAQLMSTVTGLIS